MPKSAFGFALRAGIELVAGLVVGGGIGWLLDAWLGTGPILLVLFFFLGAGAGISNVFRIARQMNQPDPEDKG
ncbi:MAG TPA: AtpZ/AtpI family protein [Xanthobacteraceae bacterium]|nr:AtpZ/AtpI family protein [Xanthobacteraceae bacterium]